MRPRRWSIFGIAFFLAPFSIVTLSAAQETPKPISSAARAYLEQALDLMQQNALHKRSVDWASVRLQTMDHASGAQTTTDTYPAIAFALTQLQERHSFLQLPDNLPGERAQAISAEIAKIRGSTHPATKPSPFFPRKEIEGHIDRRVPHLFAHVVVPMCVGRYTEWQKNGPDFQQFADKLHGIVTDLEAQKPDGWLIDLRGNSGGNMWPMLAGIGAVLGEGDLGAFEGSDGLREPWFYRAGKAGERSDNGETSIDAEVKLPPFSLPDLPWVAVLMDRSTASSGEAVAISFAGRPRERSFGEFTAGFSTANQMYPLSDGAALFLCVGIELDRTGRKYPDGVEPDVKLPAPESRPAEDKDPVIQAAEDWIESQTK